MRAQTDKDVKNIQQLLSEEAYQAVYDQYAPVLREKLSGLAQARAICRRLEQ